MAMDMPPAQAVEYRIERPARVPDQALARISTSVAQARQAAARAPERLPSTEQMLSRIDVKSAALTNKDRQSMVAGMEASQAGRMAQGVAAPNSYVGDRVRLAAIRVEAMEKSQQGRLVAEEAYAVRCRTIAIAMDRRAGAYVVGGERAAESARRSIPQKSIEQCRETIAQRGRAASQTEVAQARISTDHARQVAPVRVDPRMPHREPVRIDPQIARAEPVRVDPQSHQRKPVQIDPRSVAMASQTAGRGA